ncbi:hypothetical protein [Paraburkholderia fungorum]|uniref:hypothetical protein n=1 Tax=Paraburkholderia fungorum TaxID=134537 RepID=UPI0011C436CA|nr:hypothetical protein [Paraburkholderia fungorum]
MRPHRFQDLFYDAVFKFFQSAELLPLFSPFAVLPTALTAKSFPLGSNRRAEWPKATPASCLVAALASVKEEPGKRAIELGRRGVNANVRHDACQAGRPINSV